ncbi:MAG: sortase [Gaiellaceae bacterium]
MRLASRILGLLLIVAGGLTLAWVVVVWQWQDPFTALYTHLQQNRLSHSYERRVRAFHPKPTKGKDLAAVQVEIAAEARAYGHTIHTGDPIGRLKIGRIGLKMVVVQGTDHETLKKGPGHYAPSALPGEGHLIYIAGHRTTYLAPVAHIHDIKGGAYLTLSVPYATFTYRVQRHYIVRSDQLSVLKDHGREILRLQACHPRFFATHRYIVDAMLASITPTDGQTYAVKAAAS